MIILLLISYIKLITFKLKYINYFYINYNIYNSTKYKEEKTLGIYLSLNYVLTTCEKLDS